MKEKDKGPWWINGWISAGMVFIPIINTSLTFRDKLSNFRVRWGIDRMRYKVDPGLYGTGKPDADSPVPVTSDYKLTFDILRKNLQHTNAWVLVQNTKGMNVWCSAGDMISWATFFRFLPYRGAIFVGCFLVPALLPWVPGRSLVFKGWFVCAIATIFYPV